MEGIRGLATALEGNVRRGVSHVYVHSEGRIDALGARTRGAREVNLRVIRAFARSDTNLRTRNASRDSTDGCSSPYSSSNFNQWLRKRR